LLRSYYEPVASRKAVPAHRELHYSPVQGQPAVQQRVGIVPAGDLIVYYVPFLIVWLGHVNDDSKSSSGIQIQKTNRAHKWQRGLPKRMKKTEWDPVERPVWRWRDKHYRFSESAFAAATRREGL
jgi:hypothetical protein